MSTTLRVEFFFDDEANIWHHRVPALHINGGGTATREDAQRECMDVIAFALESDRASTTATPRRSLSRCHWLFLEIKGRIVGAEDFLLHPE